MKKYGMKANRVDKDLTQEDVAKALGMSRVQYNKWENKRNSKELKPYQKKAFADLVGVKVENIRW